MGARKIFGSMGHAAMRPPPHQRALSRIFWQGGGQEFLFSDLEICMLFARGDGAYTLPPLKFVF